MLNQAFAAVGLAREVTLHITMSMSAPSQVRAGAGVAVVDGFIRHSVPQLAHASIQVLSAELEDMAA